MKVNIYSKRFASKLPYPWYLQEEYDWPKEMRRRLVEVRRPEEERRRLEERRRRQAEEEDHPCCWKCNLIW